ncbi:OLC1v1035686C1 [Oldenlandia corymbosa var. corymbosa]|uniref:OLC1v1035686C1 n=1 Tax=Oldenlandia corymbosa var. corymbosa TaxID=529605 RepID=A0AAV1CU23_OLDCO|nr:OLC1v1035686C1 [Oldenlandia corymbosa var. corymbosa]
MAERCPAKHFVLVHGACHGAWCWYRVVVLLEKHGHKVTAVDLAASGRNVDRRLEDLRTIDDYHQPLYSFLEGLSEEDNRDKVILVGHSMGGYAVSSAMERFPEKISWGVFVSGFMLGPDLTVDDLSPKLPEPDYYMDSEWKIIQVNEKTQTHITFGNKYFAANLYQHSPPEDLQLASLLVRPTRFFTDDESKKQLLVTKEKYGSVRRAFIVGHAVEERAEMQRWNAEKNPPDMTIEIQGADHMIMFSKSQELCKFLLEIAQQANEHPRLIFEH